MGIRFIPSYPDRWYLRSNTATALLSLAIAFYYGVYEFVLTSSSDTSGIDFLLAIIAVAHALYGLTLFFVLSTHHPRLAGFLSYVLFFLMAGYSFWLTKDTTNTYFAILIIAGLLSGLYGWLLATLFNTLILVLLILIQAGNVSGAEDYSVLQIVIYAVVSAMSLLLWSAIKSEDESDQPVLKKIKTKKGKNKAGPVLSTDILINSITDGVAIIDTTGVIETWNPSAESITGWSETEAIGLDHRSVLVLADQKDTPYTDQQNPITQSLATAESQKDSSAKLQTRSNKFIEVDMQASTVHDGDKVTASVVIFRDVSKKRSEERQRAEFISTASHEMRTPVAAIEGYLALAMNDKVAKVDSTAKNYLEKAHTSTQHLGKLFQDLLTAAKSEDGRLTNNPEIVEIGMLLDELIEGVRFTAEKKGLLMEGDFGDGDKDSTVAAGAANSLRPLAYVKVDPERLREVITNLFDNAVKYTEEGKITIGMHTEDKKVTITVSDTGAGIPQEDIPHLFQKFYRVDNSATRQVGGTGLGLFISRKIIDLYNGRVWVESDEGQGSVFFISLPRVDNETAQQLLRTQSVKHPTPATTSAIPPTPAPAAPVEATPKAAPAPTAVAPSSPPEAPKAAAPTPIAKPPAVTKPVAPAKPPASADVADTAL